MPFTFSPKSREKLDPVHPELVAVMERALEISPVDFMITEGLRTLETQKKYVAEGRSQTMKSYHLKQPDGFSHAVDVAALIDGHVTWDMRQYVLIAEAVGQAADEKGVKITWGGSWKTLVDGPHFQIEL